MRRAGSQSAIRSSAIANRDSMVNDSIVNRQYEDLEAPMSDLVTINNLHKYFTRGSQRIDVLQGVNLIIPEGCFLALMGPSGSGKTTLLNLLGGLDTPSEGTINVGGEMISDMRGTRLSRW